MTVFFLGALMESLRCGPLLRKVCGSQKLNRKKLVT